MRRIRVLFVCMGNICRSPTAEMVLRHRVETAGLSADIEIDSAGTHGYHIGDAPDERAQKAAAKRGYDLSALRGRQVCAADFESFDYILAMDEVNLRALLRSCPLRHRHKLRLFGNYCAGPRAGCDIPDPYYGSPTDFEHVLDLAEEAAAGLLRELSAGLR